MIHISNAILSELGIKPQQVPTDVILCLAGAILKTQWESFHNYQAKEKDGKQPYSTLPSSLQRKMPQNFRKELGS